MTNIILLGPPYSGKSTQSKNIHDFYHLMHFSMGDILRNEINKKTKTGIEAEKFVAQGIFVPKEILQSILTDNLNVVLENKEGIIFDGYPRNKIQFETLLSLLSERKTQINLIIVLHVPEKQWMKRANYRLKNENRKDDENEEIVKKRFLLYYAETLPLLEVAKNIKIEILNINVTWSDKLVFEKIKTRLNFLIN